MTMSLPCTRCLENTEATSLPALVRGTWAQMLVLFLQLLTSRWTGDVGGLQLCHFAVSREVSLSLSVAKMGPFCGPVMYLSDPQYLHL